MPVLVIAGRREHGGAMSESLRPLTQRLPNARFLEYEQSGHFVYLDEPEGFARDVTAFLTREL